MFTSVKNLRGCKSRYDIRNLSAGKHGFHIHKYGDLRGKDCRSCSGMEQRENHMVGATEVILMQILEIWQINLEEVVGILNCKNNFIWEEFNYR